MGERMKKWARIKLVDVRKCFDEYYEAYPRFGRWAGDSQPLMLSKVASKNQPRPSSSRPSRVATAAPTLNPNRSSYLWVHVTAGLRLYFVQENLRIGLWSSPKGVQMHHIWNFGWVRISIEVWRKWIRWRLMDFRGTYFTGLSFINKMFKHRAGFRAAGRADPKPRSRQTFLGLFTANRYF